MIRAVEGIKGIIIGYRRVLEVVGIIIMMIVMEIVIVIVTITIIITIEIVAVITVDECEMIS